MRALSLLAPALALVSVEADRLPTVDDFFPPESSESCDGFAEIIEIRANARTAFAAGILFLTGDGWSGGSYSELEDEVALYDADSAEDDVLLNELNIGAYPRQTVNADFFSVEGGPSGGQERVSLIVESIDGPEGIGSIPTDCNDNQAQDSPCIPRPRGYQTLLRAPVCFKDPPGARGADVGCVDVLVLEAMPRLLSKPGCCDRRGGLVGWSESDHRREYIRC